MKKMILTLTMIAAIAVAAVPAFAQETATSTEATRRERTWPPAWVSMSLDEVKAEVADRAADGIERILRARRLSDAEKADAIAAVEDMLAAVDDAESNAEVVGLAISRVQLHRIELRAERRGETPDFEANISGDIERATRRLERLTKVASWAEAAGEDVTDLNAFLASATEQLDVATGNGTVVERHDAVHIALTWTIQAAATLDDL